MSASPHGRATRSVGVAVQQPRVGIARIRPSATPKRLASSIAGDDEGRRASISEPEIPAADGACRTARSGVRRGHKSSTPERRR